MFSPIGAILLLAVVLRGAWALIVPMEPFSDGGIYDMLAREIAAGRGYFWPEGRPAAYWPPGVSAYAGALYWIFGLSYTPIVLGNIIMSTATVWLTYLLGRQVYGEWAGIVAGLLMALWPAQIQFVTIISSELPFNFLVVGALVLWLHASAPAWMRAVGAGVILALASFVRPTALLIPLLLGYLSLVRHPFTLRNAGVSAAMTVAAFLVMALLIYPWTQRNERLFGEPVLISANGGVNLWMGNNPESEGKYMPMPEEIERLPEPERDRLLKERAVEYIKAHPERFVAGAFKKLVVTYGKETIGVVWNERALEPHAEAFTKLTGLDIFLNALKGLSSLYWWAALLLGIGGLLLRLFGGFRTFFTDPCILFWAYFAAVHAVTLGQDRYHLPSVPFIAALGGLALAMALVRLLSRNKKGEERAVSSAEAV